jgi:phosphoribosylformimino-5-aminoimidazole carboxamide ribotide isomerase
VAVLIPSIDLMGGKIVQLVQGDKKALEFDDFEEWIARFSGFPLVQLIDLDAALGRGDNRDLLRQFLTRLSCQVGGGVRSLARAQELLQLGARRVILGSSLIEEGRINHAFAEQMAVALGREKLVFAVDAKRGTVAIRGWRERTPILPRQMVEALDAWCDAFLYTHVDTEGMMQGIPKDIVRTLCQATRRQMIVAGGISSREEIEELEAMGADAVVGMALYLGRLDPNRGKERC